MAPFAYHVGWNPMQKIRDHAMSSFLRFKEIEANSGKITAIGHKLWTQHVSNGGTMTDEQIAAELADLFLAGLDTTADTLSYLFWTLSTPDYFHVQEKLRKEVRGLKFGGLPAVADTDKLPFPYLDAVLKETLRVYPINAGSQPRVAPKRKLVTIYGLEDRKSVV